MENSKIVNKIVPIESIINIVNFLEEKSAEYKNIFEQDQTENQDLPYGQKKNKYDTIILKTEYTIELHSGKIITETDSEWFKVKIRENKDIKHLCIYQTISYWYTDKEKSNDSFENNSIPTHLYTMIDFYEDNITINVDGKEKEQEVKDTYEKIKNILENNEDRYNKTIKNRNFRIQSFCISLGIVIAYIVLLIILIRFNDIKKMGGVYQLLTNGFIITVLQWFIAIVLGNLCGGFFMNMLYRDILPNKKYLAYDEYAGKSLYTDDIDDYISKDEVQIGKFFDSIIRRNKIEKIYRITRYILLIQLLISIIIMIIF